MSLGFVSKSVAVRTYRIAGRWHWRLAGTLGETVAKSETGFSGMHAARRAGREAREAYIRETAEKIRARKAGEIKRL